VLSAAVYEAQVLHSIMRVVGGAGRLAAHDVVGWVHSGRYHRSCFENRIRDAWWGSAQRLGATGAGASSPGKTAAPGRRKAPAAGAGVGSPCGVGAPPCPKLVAGPGQWWPWPRPRRLYPPPRFAGPVTLTPRLPRRLGQRHPVQGPPGSCGRRASRGGGGGEGRRRAEGAARQCHPGKWGVGSEQTVGGFKLCAPEIVYLRLRCRACRGTCAVHACIPTLVPIAHALRHCNGEPGLGRATVFVHQRGEA
jgi:hypothetical protein